MTGEAFSRMLFRTLARLDLSVIDDADRLSDELRRQAATDGADETIDPRAFELVTDGVRMRVPQRILAARNGPRALSLASIAAAWTRRSGLDAHAANAAVRVWSDALDAYTAWAAKSPYVRESRA